ncbi:MAG TPA: type II 3-dehydroquinate dehydratase [Lentisphaeria bacterium]|nr:MAG: type II 3-dehydroquinate dehydratase [Lentisphaerae bacterium GWF2_49_21]HBC88058.1 type II 3-dehydroquinate dehydratase [Lentisphaeria bacterium]
MKITVINGPNLQLLGIRKPEVYGSETLDGVRRRLESVAKELKIKISFLQSNSEGEIVDAICSSIKNGVDGIVINPAAYTHTSIAIHDALESVGIPAIEVHISNIHRREKFRRKSVTAPACIGQICGLGTDGYEWALRAMAGYLKKQN